MSRYAGFGLVLIAALVTGGCRNSETETPQPTTAPAPADTLPDQAPAANTSETAVPGEPSDGEIPIAKTPPGQTKPTVLGAIGRAVAGALTASDDNGPSEAPAYRPRQQQ